MTSLKQLHFVADSFLVNAVQKLSKLVKIYQSS